MTISDQISEMSSELARRGIPEAELCRVAEINATTWGRWKRGEFAPNMRSWDRVSAAFQQLTSASAA